MESYLLDICLVIPLAWGVLRGYWRGFFMSISSLAGLILGIYMAQLIAPYLSVLILNYFVFSKVTAYVVSYIIILISIIILTHIALKFLEGFAKLIKINWLNRGLGVIFGLLKYTFLVSVALNLMSMSSGIRNSVTDEERSQSVLYGPLKSAVPAALPYVNYYIGSYGKN